VLSSKLVVLFAIIMMSSLFIPISFVEAKLPLDLPDVSKAPQKVRVIQTENITDFARTLF